jgi:hypothetical protein
MPKILLNSLVAILLLGTIAQSATADAGQPPQQVSAEQAELLKSPAEPISWFRLTSENSRKGVVPPTKLAIIACRIDKRPHKEGAVAGEGRELEWHMPVECMRVIETVTDSAALNNLWLRQMMPNLADYASCAEVSMAYAPKWEAAHKNWAIVKVGCPTKLVDADGNIVGWHMPECQGTLPGTNYPLRCRFDPTEI